MKKGFLNGVFVVFIANVVNLLIKGLIGFIQPKFLSLDTYANIQSFTLIVAYIGVLHFGYVDGIYLRFGGERITEANRENLLRAIGDLKIMQICVTVAIVGVSFLVKSDILLYVALAVYPVNIVACYKMLFQAIGEFDRYSFIIKISAFFLLLLNVIVIFGFGNDDYRVFLSIEIISYYMVLFIIERTYVAKYIGYKSGRPIKYVEETIQYIKMGLPLMLGNIMSTLFVGMDRWFVKIFMVQEEFAYYSLAVNFETILTTVTSPIIISCYSYFCVNKDNKSIELARKSIILFASFFAGIAFAASLFIELFLHSYEKSIGIVFVVFATKVLNVVIQGVYLNLYKANKQQNIYFVRMIQCVIIGILANVCALRVFNTSISFAYATLLTMFVWLIMCNVDQKRYAMDTRDWIIILLTVMLLVIRIGNTNHVINLLIYFGIVMIASGVLYKNEIKHMVIGLKGMYLGIRHKK